MREIAIGDIHGCFDELESLLKVIGPLADDDTLIFIGDYIDRGTKSCEVVSLVRELKEKYNEQVRLLRGNHEDMMFDYFGLPASMKYDEGLWLDWNGGIETIKSFKFCGEDIKKAAQWLADNTELKVKTGNAIYVHAGLFKARKTPPSQMLWMREELFYEGKQSKLLVVGHTQVKLIGARSAPLFLEKINVIDIDNGCVYRQGPLTAYDVINKKAYYSNGEIKQL